VHRYTHGYCLEEGKPERVEAVWFILEVFRSAEVPWDCEI